MENFKIIGLVGFFLSLLSLILPWLEMTAVLGVRTTIYGFVTDGVISFILLLVCLGLVLTKSKKWKTYAIISLSFIALAIVLAALSRTLTVIEEEKITGVIISWGPGAPLMIISCLTFVVSAILMYKTIITPQ